MTVEVNHQVFSSDVMLGGITVRDMPMEHRRPMFIQADPPKHDEQRKAVSPIVAPTNLAQMESLIRSADPGGSRQRAAQRGVRLGRRRCPSS